MRAGTPNMFLRFAHCNLKCNIKEYGFDCDTDFTGSRDMNLDELMEEIIEVAGTCRNIIFTGGEPMLQLDEPLVSALKKEGYYLAVETNGTCESDVYPLLDWVTVSPKTAEHTMRVPKCDELKYVLPSRKEPPVPSIEAAYYLLSPVFNGYEIDRESLAWCVAQVNKVGKIPWRLSVQNHKFWKAR
jgi:7-carboxy-7-deazaguanine synthase